MANDNSTSLNKRDNASKALPIGISFDEDDEDW